MSWPQYKLFYSFSSICDGQKGRKEGNFSFWLSSVYTTAADHFCKCNNFMKRSTWFFATGQFESITTFIKKYFLKLKRWQPSAIHVFKVLSFIFTMRRFFPNFPSVMFLALIFRYLSELPQSSNGFICIGISGELGLDCFDWFPSTRAS